VTPPSSGSEAGRESEEAPGVVIRDKRRLDPVTGELREVAGAPASATPAGQPVEAADDSGQVAELTADLQRLSAEYANYRRRIDRDRLASAELATAAVLQSLLPVLDDIDLARQHDDLTGAFAAVAEQLAGTLAKAGLTGFGEVGDHFDPNRHEAVMYSVSADVDQPTCVVIMRRGYALGERLLRPAMVAVAEPSELAEPSEPAEPSQPSDPPPAQPTDD